MVQPADRVSETAVLASSNKTEAAEAYAFREFNELGGKFRVAVTEQCNLNCFFCHNEGQANPRQAPGDDISKVPVSMQMPDTRDALPAIMSAREITGEHLAAIRFEYLRSVIDAYYELGGHSVNLTGGEPLLYNRLFDLLDAINKPEGRRLYLNSNVRSAQRLLKRPVHPKIDSIYGSLHTLNEETHGRHLGAGSAAQIRRNILALRDHGYAILLNFSLGPHNARDFTEVLHFAAGHGLDLKVIALIRHVTHAHFYRGDWVDPAVLRSVLVANQARLESRTAALGGLKEFYRLPRSMVIVKNIALGRMHTSFCDGCSARASCGEGIYGLRTGVDAVWKPCLLRKDAYAIDPEMERVLRLNRSDGNETGAPEFDRAAVRKQILKHIAAMMGPPTDRLFTRGPPL